MSSAGKSSPRNHFSTEQSSQQQQQDTTAASTSDNSPAGYSNDMTTTLTGQETYESMMRQGAENENQENYSPQSPPEMLALNLSSLLAAGAKLKSKQKKGRKAASFESSSPAVAAKENVKQPSHDSKQMKQPKRDLKKTMESQKKESSASRRKIQSIGDDHGEVIDSSRLFSGMDGSHLLRRNNGYNISQPSSASVSQRPSPPSVPSLASHFIREEIFERNKEHLKKRILQRRSSSGKSSDGSSSIGGSSTYHSIGRDGGTSRKRKQPSSSVTGSSSPISIPLSAPASARYSPADSPRKHLYQDVRTRSSSIGEKSVASSPTVKSFSPPGVAAMESASPRFHLDLSSLSSADQRKRSTSISSSTTSLSHPSSSLSNDIPSSALDSPRSSVNEYSPSQRVRHLNHVAQKKIFFSLAEKRFILRLVEEATGESIKYSPGWSEHFADGRLIFKIWNEFFSEKPSTLEYIIVSLKIPHFLWGRYYQNSRNKNQASPYSSSTTESSPLSQDKTPNSTADNSTCPIHPSHISMITECIHSGKTEIILLILSLIIRRKVSLRFQLRNHLSLVALKYDKESIESFQQKTTPISLLKRLVNFILQECNWAEGKKLQHFHQLKDVRMYAILLRHLYPDIFSADLFSLITVVQYDTHKEKAAASIISFISEQLLHRYIEAIQPQDLISDSELIHTFVLSCIFDLRSGLPSQFRTWDMMQLCIFYLREDYPSIENNPSFRKIVNITRKVTSGDSLGTDYHELYTTLKSQNDSLQQAYHTNMEDVKSSSKKEQQELMTLFSDYKVKAAKQIEFLEEKNRDLENTLMEQNSKSQKRIHELKNEIDEVKREASQRLLTSSRGKDDTCLKEENFQEENGKTQENNDQLHSLIEDLKRQVREQQKEIRQLQYAEKKSSHTHHLPANSMPSPELQTALLELKKLREENSSLMKDSTQSPNHSTNQTTERELPQQELSELDAESEISSVSVAKSSVSNSESNSNMKMHLSLTRTDLKMVHKELLDLLSLCPSDIHLSHVHQLYGSLCAKELSSISRHRGVLKKRCNSGVWRDHFALILAPGYFLFWDTREQEWEQNAPSGIVFLHGTRIKLMKSKKWYRFHVVLPSPPHETQDMEINEVDDASSVATTSTTATTTRQKLKFSCRSSVEREEWKRHLRGATKLKSLELELGK